ncbi:hypothetical protein KFL_000130530 [Klebsormidium nitens]|uniref:tRNA-uridine aminocarboxypropyltransferase n=1 Tax=Klebsormidium nitens TaxID=105231 RepID=A0A1Y1HIY2_KLENI|nr:hypothetical protein KFL_000130530 [Klebsormidium nitens]|eukprot:GAQ78470.1 hypothetical protein KFL_000130530 [Klebsormidium nitens]
MLTSSRCTATPSRAVVAARVRGSVGGSVAGFLTRDFLASSGDQQSGGPSTNIKKVSSRRSPAGGEHVIWKSRFISCLPAGFSKRNVLALASEQKGGALAAEMPSESVTGVDSIEEFHEKNGQCNGASFGEAPLSGSRPCVPNMKDTTISESTCGGSSVLETNAPYPGIGVFNQTQGEGGVHSKVNEHRASASESIADINGGTEEALLSSQQCSAAEGVVEPALGASAKRPFCKQCQKPAVVCICATIPKAKVANKTKLVVLQHYKERKHPLGSVRFAKLGFENVEVVVVKELGSGLPWLKPPFSRKERARARALARAEEHASTSADTPPGPSEHASENRKEDLASSRDLSLDSAPTNSSVSQLSASSPVPASARIESHKPSEAPTGEKPGSTPGKGSTGEALDQVAGIPLGGDSLPAESGASGEANGSLLDPAITAAQLEPEVQEVRWERDKSGRKVRYPTFAPPPGIELTPGTAVLFPGPQSVDLLEAAQFWGLAVQSSPFSPALPSLDNKVPATTGCDVLPGASNIGGSSNESGGMSGVVEKQLGAALESTEGFGSAVIDDVTQQLGAASLGTSEDCLSSVGRASNAAATLPTPAVELGALEAAEPLKPKTQNRPERAPMAFPEAPPDQLILIDGTWSKATRVYHEHGWLHSLPQYKLPLGKRTSRYRNLRKEPKKEYLSTLESGAWALQLIEPALVDDIEGVLDSFGEMIKRQAEYQAEAVRQGRCWRLAEP